jgi:hypothetical protein
VPSEETIDANLLDGLHNIFKFCQNYFSRSHWAQTCHEDQQLGVCVRAHVHRNTIRQTEFQKLLFGIRGC